MNSGYTLLPSIPKLVQIVATGKVAQVPDWVYDEMIADGRAKPAMIRQVFLDGPSHAEVLDPGLVVVETYDLMNLW